MIETVNSSRAELRDPRRAIRIAVRELRHALPTGWWLFRHRLLTQRRTSLLGHVWLFAPALVMLATAMLLQRGGGIAVGPTPLAYPAFVLIGLVGWHGFVDAVNAPYRRLTDLRHLLTRTLVPHEAVLIAASLDALMTMAVRALVAFPVVWLVWTTPGWSAIALPLLLVGIVLIGLAIGLLVAPYALIFSDVQHMQALALMLGLFLTPIFYPLHAWAFHAWNPMAVMIDALRGVASGGGAPRAAFLMTGVAAVLLIAGWGQYRIARPFLISVQG